MNGIVFLVQTLMRVWMGPGGGGGSGIHFSLKKF